MGIISEYLKHNLTRTFCFLTYNTPNANVELKNYLIYQIIMSHI